MYAIFFLYFCISFFFFKFSILVFYLFIIYIFLCILSCTLSFPNFLKTFTIYIVYCCNLPCTVPMFFVLRIKLGTKAYMTKA